MSDWPAGMSDEEVFEEFARRQFEAASRRFGTDEPAEPPRLPQDEDAAIIAICEAIDPDWNKGAAIVEKRNLDRAQRVLDALMPGLAYVRDRERERGFMAGYEKRREEMVQLCGPDCETDKTEKPAFAVGDRVRKPNGYPFDSTVVAVFTKLDGQTRLVCESDAIPGMLHIFSPSQMEVMK